MQHPSLRRSLAAMAVACLAAAGLAGAGEVCLDPSPSFGCYPCDLPIEVSAIGYSNSGPPCESPVAGSSDLPGGESEPRDWWMGLLTLSSSDQDPFVNSGPFLGEETLHVWLVDSGCGYGFGGSSVGVTSDFPLESYEPVSSGIQTWSPSPDRRTGTLQLNLGCLGACASYPGCPPVLVGTFRVSRVRHQSVPIETSTWMDLKSRWRSEPSGAPTTP